MCVGECKCVSMEKCALHMCVLRSVVCVCGHVCWVCVEGSLGSGVLFCVRVLMCQCFCVPVYVGESYRMCVQHVSVRMCV